MKTLATAADCKIISLDFHGVISASTEFFKQFSAYAHSLGIKIYIVSGGPRADIAAFLQNKQIYYDELWCVIDVPEINEKTHFFADGSFRVDDKLWDKAKGYYCRAQNIDLHIDDSYVYGQYFTTGYCRYEAKTNRFYLNNCVFTAEHFNAEFFANLMECAKLSLREE